MNIKDFFNKAIEGGWKYRGVRYAYEGPQDIGLHMIVSEDKARVQIISECEILLDPTAWKAVGKVERWKGGQCILCGGNIRDPLIHNAGCPFVRSGTAFPRWGEGWMANMNRMIGEIMKGKTPHQFLDTL